MNIKENQLKGFSFNKECTGFIISNPKKAFRWAYDLGLGWNSSYNIDVYRWFYSFFDPSYKCLDRFRQNYQRMSKNDALFYTKLIVSYFRGLLKTRSVDRKWLFNEWGKFRTNMISTFDLDPYTFPTSL